MTYQDTMHLALFISQFAEVACGQILQIRKSAVLVLCSRHFEIARVSYPSPLLRVFIVIILIFVFLPLRKYAIVSSC